MKTLYATQGLPASGKSTWAREKQTEITAFGGSCKIINKDSLRGMLDSGAWSQEREKFIITARNALIREALRAGHHVICADCNFGKNIEQLRQIAKNESANFEVLDFTGIPLDVCLERDKDRANYVGEDVILDMHEKYLAQPVAPPEFVIGAPLIFICDIDGTVALKGDRNQFDETRVGEDKANKPIVSLVYQLRNSYQPVYVSGRHEACQYATERWLCDLSIFDCGSRGPKTPLFMRANGDDRDDRIIKREIYEREIKGKYNVAFVLDDRDKVVRMWRSLGLTCLQVAPGRF